MIVVLHIAATFVVMGAGFALLSLLRRPDAAASGWGETAALCYLLGLAALTGWMELLDRFSIPVRAPAVLTVLALPAALLAAVIAGGVYGFIPGMLKAYTGAHEVVTTIMLNYVAIQLVGYAIT
ncbi:MAG: hypothetical protein Q8R92_01395, partial [Deltaproteobacteria bacterium]|nr:hypothetical protein [Deltaproteobacteria bacterium]